MTNKLYQFKDSQIFEKAFNAINGYAFLVDQDFILQKHNDNMLVHGTDSVGVDLKDLLLPEALSTFEKSLTKVLTTGAPERIEHSLEIEGECRYFSALITLVSSEEKPPLFFVHAQEFTSEMLALESLGLEASINNFMLKTEELEEKHKNIETFLTGVFNLIRPLFKASAARWLTAEGSARKVDSTSPSTLKCGPLHPDLSEKLSSVFESGKTTALAKHTQILNGESANAILAVPLPVLRPSRVLLLERNLPFTEPEVLLAGRIAMLLGNRAAALKIEQQLRESEKHNRVIIEHAPDAIVMLEGGIFTDVNPAATRLFKRSKAEIIGRSIADFSPPYQADGRTTKEAIVNETNLVLENGFHAFEWTHETKDGEPILCEVKIVALKINNKNVMRGSIMDITHRKKQELERRKLEAQLRQAQKMEAIGQLTGGVAHDFNNLLTVVLGNLELLRLEADNQEAVLELSEQALEGAKRGAALTQRLLAFSRKQALQPKPISLNTMVGGMENLLHRTLGEHIEIESVQAAGLWRCFADLTQVENAVLNLAINARDAMPTGGKLTIETANVRLDREYASVHQEVVPGQYVMLAVSDTGSGIPQEYLEKVFDPFFTTKDIGKGSGLGLSMVYGFTKQSGGHIKIYSEIGEGTTIKVYLPKAKSTVPEKPTAQRSLEQPKGNGEQIMVVEDDAGVRHLTVSILERLGYKTVAFDCAETAFSFMKENRSIDLLLTDVVLPGDINGVKLSYKLLKLKPDLKVLYMSGYTENAIIHHGRLDAGVELVEKPFTQLELAHRVRETLDLPPVKATASNKTQKKE